MIGPKKYLRLPALVFAIVAIGILYRCHITWSLVYDEDTVPVAFYRTYRNICKCTGMVKGTKEVHFKSNTLACFASNKERLLDIAKNKFSPLSQEYYDKFVLALLELVSSF